MGTPELLECNYLRESCATFSVEPSGHPNTCSQQGDQGASSADTSTHTLPTSPSRALNPQLPLGRALSPSSPSQLRRLELLKCGSPKSKVMESLRLKIQQQRLNRGTLKPTLEVKRQTHITRKVCRVTHKGAKTAVGTAGVTRLSVRKAPITLPTGGHARRASGREHSIKGKQSSYISAWRDAQRLVMHILGTPVPMSPGSQHAGSSQAEGNTGRLVEESLQQAVASNATEHLAQDQPNSDIRNTEKSKIVIRIHPDSEKHKSVLTASNEYAQMPKSRIVSMSNINKKHANTNQDPTKGASPKAYSLPASKAPRADITKDTENKGSSRSSNPQRQGIQAVREFMHRQVRERKMRERLKRKMAEQMEEKRRQSVQAVLRRQREALHKASKEEKNSMREKNSQEITSQKEEKSSAQVPAPRLSDLNNKPSLEVTPKQQQLDALQRIIASLDKRTEDEARRLGLADRGQRSDKRALIYKKPCGEREENKMTTNSVKDQGRCPMPMPENATREKQSRRPTDMGTYDMEDVPSRTESHLQRQQQRERIVSAAGHSDISESTDCTSKWSELSEPFGRGHLRCRLSLAQSQQFLREEELRARQYSALFRLREEALWEKTQAELAWLDHRGKNANTEEKGTMAEIKSKQEGILSRFWQEQAEIQHWHNAYKCGKQQRKLLLHHQRDILAIQRSACQLREALQSRAVSECTGPRDMEDRRFAVKDRNTPETKAKHQPPGIDRFLTKAGWRKLLAAEEVWSFGRKRNVTELGPMEQCKLPTPGSDPCDPCPLLRNPQQSHALSVDNEQQVKKEDKNSQSQHGSVRAAGPTSYGQETVNNKIVPYVHEEAGPLLTHERVSGDEPQYSPMDSRRPLKMNHHNSPSQRVQSGHGVSDRTSLVSSLSSDIEEDLPFDYEEDHVGPEEGGVTELRETAIIPNGVDADQDAHVMTNSATHNVHNDRRSLSILSLNNNQDYGGKGPEEQWRSQTGDVRTEKIITEPEINGQWEWLGTQSPVTDNLDRGGANQDRRSGDMKTSCGSPSCGSLSETDGRSEPVSFHSEVLASSEDDSDLLSEERADASVSLLVYAEKATVVPDHSQIPCNVNTPGQFSLQYYDRQGTIESTLSEILSPVDEILSYGSAELPSSIRVGAGSGLESFSLPPPPPAHEIITWTSEEDLPAPPNIEEDLSINSENVPPLPADQSLGRVGSSSPDSLGLRETGETDEPKQTLFQTVVPPEDIEEDEKDQSEFTSSLPADERYDQSDPLSSFHIGDRVLVCNSRPGVLRFKGPTVFASGFWAGVALDSPNGNHNGTFRGVTYFTCEKNCGVLVRPEDISPLQRKQSSNLETGVGEGSDEEPPNGSRPQREGSAGHRANLCRPPSSPGVCHPSASKQTHQHGQLRPTFPVRELENPATKIEQECSPSALENKLRFNGPDMLAEKLAEEMIKDVVRDAQETKRRGRLKMRSLQDWSSTDTEMKRRKDRYFTAQKPCLLDHWHYAKSPATLPNIQTPAHDQAIVYSLVNATIDTLFGQADESIIEAYETPNYLVDDESRRAYRQLTTDTIYEVLADILDIGLPLEIKDASMLSLLQSSNFSITEIKAAVREEIRKVLNLERTDQQMTEMLQSLCKYWYAKRDRVDYILIQELQREEKHWVDYSSDQFTVKAQLAEDIFCLLLDDTVSVVNHIYSSALK